MLDRTPRASRQFHSGFGLLTELVRVQPCFFFTELGEQDLLLTVRQAASQASGRPCVLGERSDLSPCLGPPPARSRAWKIESVKSITVSHLRGR